VGVCVDGIIVFMFLGEKSGWLWCDFVECLCKDIGLFVDYVILFVC